MANVVGGVVASHSTLMNTDFERVGDVASATAFRDALGEAKAFLASVKPDVLICLGSNHFRGFFMDLMPSFSLGVGEVIGTGEGGTPAGPLPARPDVARLLLEGLSAKEFDVAFSIRMHIDHGITHAVQHLSPSPDVPIIPIVTNVFAPPLPKVSRCVDLALAIREVVSEMPDDIRVAVIGSGGMSHQLPWPDWRAPETEADRFLVEAWLNGREDWERYEVPRRELIRAAEADIAPAFDHQFLDDLVKLGGPDMAARYEDVESRAGNGGAELRNWMAARAIVGEGAVDVLGYWPIEEWLTGMGVALLHPEASAPARERAVAAG